MDKKIKSHLKLLLLTFILLFTSSCGFTPIYKKNNNTKSDLIENIEIVPINSIEGADFYNHLSNLLPHGDNPKYVLSVSQVYSNEISIIQKNSDVLREAVKITINYSLSDKLSGKILTNGSFSRFSSYNTTFSPYSNSIKKQDIRKNLSISSAEEVRNRIMLYNKP